MNDLVLAAVASMAPAERPQIVHQAGEKLYEGLTAGYASAGVDAEVLPFVRDMAERYAWCDVLVCRSGAITVAEIGAAGVGRDPLPLPWFVADEQAAERRLPRLPRRGHRLEAAGNETPTTRGAPAWP
jgi:UDP-N-acetylglucosamine--N-acetylmuramyl-(pentapeptide) pyrophosphoryl-undecaprenol N-acetylglucosamine transferase